MALTLESGATSRWRGLSTDKKPGEPGISDDQPVRVGSIVTETDTGDRYVWQGSWPWVLQEVSISLLFAELMAIEQEQLRVLPSMIYKIRLIHPLLLFLVQIKLLWQMVILISELILIVLQVLRWELHWQVPTHLE